MEEINKSYMGFSEGMIVGPTMEKYIGGMRQVDWIEAKKFIEENKDKIESVKAGLAEDWGYTADTIWTQEKGYLPQGNVYGASSWATPSINVVYVDGSSKTYECWMLGEDAGSYFED